MIAIPYYETSYFVFSNFSAHAVLFEGVMYPTAEHAFQAQKFTDEHLRKQVQKCPSPLAAWELAHKLKSQQRADWGDVKVAILTNIVRAKVQQNADVKTALVQTHSEKIVELNPNDSFWGNGSDGKGQNQMGKILMSVRQEFATSKY